MAYTIAWYPNIRCDEYFETIWLIIPKPGSMRMYTSGCPKNQNMCWNKIGSPPPTGEKNVVLKWRSVNIIVIPAARAGSAVTSKIDVINTDHTNKGILNIVIPLGLILRIVTIMLIAPKIDEAPARCILRIAKSTEGPAWDLIPLKGGYSVHPVPAASKNIELTNR